jgi:hypothetical protein
MTALTVPARPDEDDARLRPVPWRRMAGVIWRQHRFALAAVAVLLGALAVYEWLTGESLHHAWAAAIACHPAGSPACQGPVNTFDYMENFVSLGGPLQMVPALIGAFAGAFTQCLAQHGYTQWTSYQPASRFWPFQWIEGGWLLALSALLIAATIWLVRRRAA